MAGAGCAIVRRPSPSSPAAIESASREAAVGVRRRHACSSSRTSSTAATSRSRSWATRTATSSTSASASARSSAATRRSSRSRRRRASPTTTRDGAVRRRARARPPRRLRERRHGRVPRRRRRHDQLPRGQHPPAGRAPGHRGGDRASTSSSCSCASPPASRCRSRRTTFASTGTPIEVRLVAEDPAAGWLPSTGHDHRRSRSATASASTPASRAGSVVSADYDSLLAKVIAHAPDRGRRRRTRWPGRCARRRRRRRAHQHRHARRDPRASPTSSPAARRPPTSTSIRDGPGRSRSRTATTGWRSLLAAVFAAEAARPRRRPRCSGFAPSGWRNLRTQGQRQIWID